jgi:hypothetical protein
MGTELLEALQECGSRLPESHKPSPVNVYDLFAGLLYWLETGSTVAPEPAAEPSPLTVQEAELSELRSRLAAAEAKIPPADLPASPVAPVPQTPNTAPESGEPVPPAAPGVSDVPSEPVS